MSDFNKPPLLKASFKMLVEHLRLQDHMSIVVYAGAAGVVLEPTSGLSVTRTGYSKSEDFNNDKKVAGGLGSGHTVTALYEVVPVGVQSEFFKIDELKYQRTKIDPAYRSEELLTVKFRYKNVSRLIVHPLMDSENGKGMASDDFRWSAAVAAFGMMLRESEFINGSRTTR